MMRFCYKALNRQGQEVFGEISARNKDTAINRFKREGLRPIILEEFKVWKSKILNGLKTNNT
jgi:type II secretory pathway component PulF